MSRRQTLPRALRVKDDSTAKNEPCAIRELHRIRQAMHADGKRVGNEKSWAEANRQGKEFACRHGLKYVETPPRVAVARERRGKYKSR
ncbi:MAG TPA: hypothetical protein VL171_04395 [Verrucomicrobiae bacterium]|nr:hypothetical protein [Verrucomicrobiae bacterium]